MLGPHEGSQIQKTSSLDMSFKGLSILQAFILLLNMNFQTLSSSFKHQCQ